MQPSKCLSYVLCLGAVLVTLAPAQSPSPENFARPRRVELQRALASFASWTRKNVTKSGSIFEQKSLQEGIELAKQRRAALRELLQSDPALALAESIPFETRKLLPREVQDQLETPIHGIGDLLVACAVPVKGAAPADPIQRFVRIDGRTYRTFVYGRRLSETTKFKIPLHGVVVGNVVALHEMALEELAPSEAQEAAEPVIDLRQSASAPKATGPARLARMGKTLYRFASEEHLKQSEALLEEAEASSQAEQAQPAATLLEQGPAAKINQPKVARPQVVPAAPKRVLVVRVDFPDLPGDPAWIGNSQPFTTNALQSLADSQIGTYYRNSSYGQVTMAFTITPKVYRLPQTAVNYATVSLYFELHDDAVAAAQADYVVTDYDIVVVLFSFLGNIPGSEIQFGGLTLLGTGMVWVNGEFDFRVVAHEFGHTYGLYHANVWQTSDGNPVSDRGTSSEYGDIFDTMGANWGNDRRTDFNPWFKSMLNWFGDGQVQTITTNGVYRVYRFDDPGANGTLALRITKDANRDYWIGARRNFTENATMEHGAYVIWGYHYARQSNLLGLGATPNDVRGAALVVGGVLADTEANLTISPIAEGGESPGQYLDIQVTFGPPVMILAQPQAQEVLEPQDAQFSVGVAPNSSASYLWECQPAGTTNWVVLSDGTQYTGTTTATLLVNSANVSMSGDTFRCVLTNAAGGFNCSQPAVLTVNRFGISTLAGQPGFSGAANGVGRIVQFSTMMGIAVDSAGNSYVADSGNHVVRKITPAGVTTTVAGAQGQIGNADGPGTAARFNFPTGIAVDSDGTIYVTDQDNSTIRKITSAGVVTTIAGLAGSIGADDGIGPAARFNLPGGIAVDCYGNLYIADTGNQTVRKVASDGTVSTLAGQPGLAGFADGRGAEARFNHPTGIAIDLAGNLYVADHQNFAIRKIVDEAQVITLAGTPGTAGSADGLGTNALFNAVWSLAVDIEGTIYVADGTNSIRKVTPIGLVSTPGVATNSASATTSTGSSYQPISATGVAVDNQGTVYAAQSCSVQIIRDGAVPLPTLLMNLVAGQIVLTWPASAPGFGLEMRSDLSENGAWSPVSSGPAIVGCNFVFTNSVQAPSAFFRLHKH